MHRISKEAGAKQKSSRDEHPPIASWSTSLYSRVCASDRFYCCCQRLHDFRLWVCLGCRYFEQILKRVVENGEAFQLLFNEKVLNSVQTWLPGFSAMCHYTKFGMASSFFYNAFLTDFNQTFELAPISMTFNSRSTEQDLINILIKIKCDIGELSQLRNEAEKFRREFLDSLKDKKQ